MKLYKIEKKEQENIIIGFFKKKINFLKNWEELCKNNARIFQNASLFFDFKSLIKTKKLKNKYFYIFLKNIFPITITKYLKNFCDLLLCTGNNAALLIHDAEIIGVLDGLFPLKLEKARERKERINFLKKIGYIR